MAARQPFDFASFSYDSSADYPGGTAESLAALEKARELNRKYADEFEKAYQLYREMPGHAVASTMSQRTITSRLHRGEAVLNNLQPSLWRRGDELIDEVVALLEEVATLRVENNSANVNILKSTRATADVIDRVVRSGDGMVLSTDTEIGVTIVS